jgi:hypothetical protein
VRRRRRRTRSVHSLCVGCGIEPRNDEIAGAETVFMVERNMCNAAMRGIVVPPGSKATSRAKGSRRNLGYLVAGRRRVVGAGCGGANLLSILSNSASSRRRYVRFRGSPDMADYPPRLVYDANDPQPTKAGFEIPQRSSTEVCYSFSFEAREVLGSETPRVHHAARRF